MPVLIVVIEKSEPSKPLAEFNDVNGSLLVALDGADLEHVPLLKWVWRYDDTTYNSRQANAIASELHLLARGQVDQVQADLQAIGELAVETAQRPHRQLVFLGD